MTPFRWQNCYADVQTYRHDRTLQSYLDDVILPSLKALDRRIEEFEKSEEAWAPFEKSDMQDVLRETKMAFALAVQSVWERQIRAYLSGCAKELRPDDALAAKIERADWKALRKLFRDLRGIQMEAFPSFTALHTLQLLGNASRHGDGTSAIELTKRCPDLWPSLALLPSEVATVPLNRTVAAMVVSETRLREFVDAIVEFWQDVEYIYNESIEAKHPSLEAKLVRERVERKWMPKVS